MKELILEQSYFTVGELTRRWRVHRNTVLRWLGTDLPHLRLNGKTLVPIQAVFDWEAKHTITPNDDQTNTKTNNKEEYLEMEQKYSGMNHHADYIAPVESDPASPTTNYSPLAVTEEDNHDIF